MLSGEDFIGIIRKLYKKTANLIFFYNAPVMRIPFLPNSHSVLLPAFLSAILVIFILIFLKPFGIYYDHFDIYYFSLLAGYGLLSFFPIALLERYYPKIYPSCKTISFSAGAVITLSVISAIVWKYSHFLHVTAPEFHFPAFSFPDAVFKAFAVGLIPLSIRGIFINMKAHQIKELSSRKDAIQLTSADGRDWFKIDQESILFIKSSDNYVEIHYKTDDRKIRKRLIRNTISALEEQLIATSLFRCHRSFLVNLEKVCDVEGNRKSMVLFLSGLHMEISVSRTRITEFQYRMKLKKPESVFQ